MWYRVPPCESFITTLQAFIAPGGKSTDWDYSLAHYNPLPAGQYRIVVKDLTAEFTVQ